MNKNNKSHDPVNIPSISSRGPSFCFKLKFKMQKRETYVLFSCSCVIKTSWSNHCGALVLIRDVRRFTQQCVVDSNVLFISVNAAPLKRNGWNLTVWCTRRLIRKKLKETGSVSWCSVKTMKSIVTSDNFIIKIK